MIPTPRERRSFLMRPMATVRRLLGAILAVGLMAPTAADSAVLILPVDYEHYILTAASTREPHPQKTQAGRANLQEAADAIGAATFTLKPLPTLTRAEQITLDEHRALLELVLKSSIESIKKGDLKHKRSAYDFRIGQGLDWLAEKSGADKMLLIVGERQQSTKARLAMFAANVATLSTGAFNVVPALGGSYTAAALVDLRDGRLEWANVQSLSRVNLGNPRRARAVLEELVGVYPDSDLMDLDRDEKRR
ncbi:MAG: hypothetical protein AAF465_14455 [Pseudomonadota bacterium]